MTSQSDAAIIAKIRKLMSLAENNPSAAEAEAAANKVQELLTEYGITMLAVERGGGTKSTRSDTRLGGGLYKWQRTLWQKVAELNYSMYWSHKGLEKGSKYEHRLLGSEVNVVSTQVMAEYLQGTVERMARERVNNVGARFFTKENIEYREGIATTLANRLTNLRWDREQEARKAKANQPTANALTILDVIDAEKDANDDYLYGEGYSARRRATHAANAARWAEQKAAKDAWRLAFPQLAAAEDEAARIENAKWEAKWAKQNANRKPKVVYKSDAYFDGIEHGRDISLNQQVDKAEDMKRIG